ASDRRPDPVRRSRRQSQGAPRSTHEGRRVRSCTLERRHAAAALHRDRDHRTTGRRAAHRSAGLMSTFGSILSIARTAIAAQQTAVQVVSQNVANSEPEGYSRQRAELATATPQRFGYGSVGTGVKVANVTRMRDTMLDSSYRQEAASAEGFGLRRDVL